MYIWPTLAAIGHFWLLVLHRVAAFGPFLPILGGGGAKIERKLEQPKNSKERHKYQKKRAENNQMFPKKKRQNTHEMVEMDPTNEWLK